MNYRIHCDILPKTTLTAPFLLLGESAVSPKCSTATILGRQGAMAEASESQCNTCESVPGISTPAFLHWSRQNGFDFRGAEWRGFRFRRYYCSSGRQRTSVDLVIFMKGGSFCDPRLQVILAGKLVRITVEPAILMATHHHLPCQPSSINQKHWVWGPGGMYLSMSSSESNMQAGVGTNAPQRRFPDQVVYQTLPGEMETMQNLPGDSGLFIGFGRGTWSFDKRVRYFWCEWSMHLGENYCPKHRSPMHAHSEANPDSKEWKVRVCWPGYSVDT